MDEAGYSFNWTSDLDIQPHYVLSAVCFPCEQLFSIYQEIRNEVSKLNIGEASESLGQGFEIKARDIAAGSGYWRSHDNDRNAVRDIMLLVPKKYGAKAFVAVINKLSLRQHYVDPIDPYKLSLDFIFERIQMYLSDINDYSICIYDQNKRLEDCLQSAATDIIRQGSGITYIKHLNDSIVLKTFLIDRILEFSFGRSENSIGLQVADFFATMTNSYVKSEKPPSCGWWDKLESVLHHKKGKIQDIGYKGFPLIDKLFVQITVK
ncbi:MAG: DUF3800 domain-containing protein [Spirochaetes bacterium]|nr:DUF3800 domain-containing protein [Spirochaetota bacterium]